MRGNESRQSAMFSFVDLEELFAAAALEVPLFAAVLARYFTGQPDPETLRRLRMPASARAITI